MNKKSKEKARLAKRLRAAKTANDASDAAMESEEEGLRKLGLLADERGDAPPKMSVKVRKRLKLVEIKNQLTK